MMQPNDPYNSKGLLHSEEPPTVAYAPPPVGDPAYGYGVAQPSAGYDPHRAAAVTAYPPPPVQAYPPPPQPMLMQQGQPVPGAYAAPQYVVAPSPMGAYANAPQQQQQHLPMQPGIVGVPPPQPPPPSKEFTTGGAPNVDTPQDPHRYRDLPWMIFFYLHFLVILIVCFAVGAPALANTQQQSNNPAAATSAAHPVVGILIVGSVIGTVLSGGWMLFMQRYAQSLIICTLYFSLACSCVMALIMFFSNILAGVILLIFAMLFAWYIYSIRPRIPFATANLTAAIAAVRKYPATISVAFFMLLAQFIWVVIWSIALYGVEVKTQGDGYIFEFLMLISFFWGQQVISNLVHCTTAGTVGSWWFVQAPVNPTWGSFRRALTTSFGSICFGSLIVAVLKAIIVVLRAARRSARNRRNAAAAFLLCIAQCFVDVLERLIQYFNHYAFVHVALYGKDFRTAGKDAFTMFQERGFTTVINDDIIGRVLLIGCYIVGAITAVIGAAWARGMASDSGWVFAGAFLAFIIGFATCYVASTVVDSAVATVFVCFADQPEALALTHPQEFGALVTAWRQFYPQEFTQCGYESRLAPYTNTPGVANV